MSRPNDQQQRKAQFRKQVKQYRKRGKVSRQFRKQETLAPLPPLLNPESSAPSA